MALRRRPGDGAAVICFMMILSALTICEGPTLWAWLIGGFFIMALIRPALVQTVKVLLFFGLFFSVMLLVSAGLDPVRLAEELPKMAKLFTTVIWTWNLVCTLGLRGIIRGWETVLTRLFGRWGAHGAMMLTLPLAMVPELLRRYRAIEESTGLRTFGRTPPWSYLGSRLYPFFVISFMKTGKTADSMALRLYNDRRTPEKTQFTAVDATALILSALALGTTIILKYRPDLIS